MITVHYDETTGNVVDATGYVLGMVAIGLNVKPVDSEKKGATIDDIIKMKASGFTADDIVKMGFKL